MPLLGLQTQYAFMKTHLTLALIGSDPDTLPMSKPNQSAPQVVSLELESPFLSSAVTAARLTPTLIINPTSAAQRLSRYHTLAAVVSCSGKLGVIVVGVEGNPCAFEPFSKTSIWFGKEMETL
ncbi:hypothetical protein PAMP_001671 [Pampus punctatissimus]